MSNLEKRVLLAIKNLGGENVDVDSIVSSGFQLVEVMNAVSWLRVKGLLRIQEKLNVEYCLNRDEKLPERQVYDLLRERGEIDMKELSTLLPREVVGVGVGNLKRYGIEIVNGRLIFRDVEDEIRKRERVIEKMRERCLSEDEVDRDIINDLLRRRGLVKKREKVKRFVTLTKKGWDIVNSGLEIKEEISQLTPELIQSGRWRDYELRRYDVTLFAPKV